MAERRILTELLERYEVSIGQINKRCTNTLACDIAAEIIDYETLGMYLGLTPAEIAEVKEDNSQCKQRKTNLIVKWIDKEGDDATELALIRALIKMNKKRIAELLIGKHSAKVRDTYGAHEDFPSWNQKMETSLQIENSDVVLKYAALEAKVKSSLSTSADIRILKDFIRQAGHVPLYQQVEPMSNIIEVLNTITKHTNWYNYELFEGLIDGLGSDEHKAEFQAYKNDHLLPYLERAMFKIPPGSVGTDNDNEALLHLKILDHIDLNGQDLKVVQNKLAYRLKLQSPGLLILSTYKKGCIGIVFSIDKHLLQSIKCASSSLPIRWNKESECYEIEDITSLMLSPPIEEQDAEIVKKILNYREVEINRHLTSSSLVTCTTKESEMLQELKEIERRKTEELVQSVTVKLETQGADTKTATAHDSRSMETQNVFKFGNLKAATPHDLSSTSNEKIPNINEKLNPESFYHYKKLQLEIMNLEQKSGNAHYYKENEGAASTTSYEKIDKPEV